MRGFASIVTVLLVVAAVSAVLVGGLTLRHFSQKQLSESDSPPESRGHSQLATQAEWPVLWGPPGSPCQNNSSVKFEATPIALGDIDFVEPMGELKEGHILPGDHIGINYKTSPTSTPVKVFAPAEATLVTVERHAFTPPSGYPSTLRHYHIYLVHSCTFFTGYVHLTDFAPEILAASPELQVLHQADNSQSKNINLRLPVKAGQELGTTWSFGLLGMVTVNLDITNRGYLKPASYQGENWRVHSVSPFESFPEPLKSQILAKNPRTASPVGGKIDFDVPSKLVGSWFQEGSGGYRNLAVEPKQCGNFPCPYWNGHIAFVYDYIDPNQLRVSIGHDSGLATKTPFGIKGNSPDFKEIGVEDGLVKYGLVALKDVSRQKGYVSNDPLIEISDESRYLGLMLVNVVDSDTIKVEVFPGKTPDQVTAFTANARVYHR